MSETPHTAPKAVTPKKPSTLFVNYYGVLFLGIVGAFLLAGFFILRPLLEGYKVLQAEAAVKTVQLEDQRRYLDSLNRSIAAAQQIPPETLEDVEEALPSDAGIPELLEALSRIALTHQVQLSNIQFSSPITDPGQGQGATNRGNVVQSMVINMNLASPNYAATRRYLDAIERNLRLFDVQTIAVSPGQGETGQAYTVQLRTYLLPPSTRP